MSNERVPAKVHLQRAMECETCGSRILLLYSLIRPCPTCGGLLRPRLTAEDTTFLREIGTAWQ